MQTLAKMYVFQWRIRSWDQQFRNPAGRGERQEEQLAQDNLLFDFQNQSIKVKDQILTTPSDNEAMKFLNDQCPPKKGVSSSNHKITDQVDRAIITLVKTD